MAIDYLKGENPTDLLITHHPRWTEKIPMKGLKIRKAGFKSLKAFWKAAQQNVEIPTSMTLQKSLTKTGGQMHFKNGGGKKKPKVLSAKKTKKGVKKKGSDNLMTFGIKLPDVRTLEDLVR